MRHHGRGLFQITKNKALVSSMEGDYAKADIPAKDMAMLEYAVKLTSDPCHMERTDVERLRQAGFNDASVLDIAQVTAYYNFVNRLACGLGVELEEYWKKE
jgi:uncharacterized peroxidase-related enzyme